MIKLDLNKFKDDVKNGILDNSKEELYGETGFNISHYVMKHQFNTRLYDYINKDVFVFFTKDFDYRLIEDYGNGVPDWVYDTLETMLKVARG